MSNGRNSSRKKKNRAVPASPARTADAGNGLLDRYLVLMLFLALISLTLLSAETPLLVGLLGLALCVAGFTQGPVKVDLWVLIPLVLYQVFSLFSLFMAYRSVEDFAVNNYVILQWLYPVFYLLLAYLDDRDRLMLKRLCAAWAAFAAAAGLVQFVYRALDGRAARLGGIFNAPNAMGIFLVVAWFVLRTCGPRPGEPDSPWVVRLMRLEPLILAALALTLSMGSFVCMALGILMLVIPRLRRGSWREGVLFACGLLARAAFGFGMGLLLYLAARRTNAPWLCVPLLLYVLAVAFFWDRFLAFLDDFPKLAVTAAAMGALVAVAAILVRPSAVDTFAERLAMMRNGLGYLTEHPLWGLGPDQWHLRNIQDSDIFYATRQIHNVPLHIGVELGIPAMLALVIIAVRRLQKSAPADDTAGFAAFAAHSLIDTGYFYPGVAASVWLTCSEPSRRGRQISSAVAKLIFAAFAVMFLATALCAWQWGR